MKKYAKGGLRCLCDTCKKADDCTTLKVPGETMVSCSEYDPVEPEPTCPKHYMAGPYECKKIERAISDKMRNEYVTDDLNPYESRLYFAAFEYLWRAPFKGDMVKDLRKCVDDLQDLIGCLDG